MALAILARFVVVAEVRDGVVSRPQTVPRSREAFVVRCLSSSRTSPRARVKS